MCDRGFCHTFNHSVSLKLIRQIYNSFAVQNLVFFRVLSCSTNFDKTNQSRPYRTVSTTSRNNVEQKAGSTTRDKIYSQSSCPANCSWDNDRLVPCKEAERALSTPRSALYSTGDSVPVQAPAITRSTGKTGGFMTRRRTSYSRRAGLLNCVTSGRDVWEM